MANLVYSAIASADGYVEDEQGKFDWGALDEEVHAFVNDLERPAGTHLYGRRMYETMVYWETDDGQGAVARDYAAIWRAAEKVVYSRTLQTVSSEKTRIERDFEAAAIKQLKPSVKVFGVEPELAGDTAASFRIGSIVEWPAELTSRTMADGLRTQSVGVRNFAHIQRYVDGIITVSEAEIRAAMRAIVMATRLVPEPSGAVASAALLFHADELPPYRKAVAIVSGGNVSIEQLGQVLTEAGA